MLPIKRKLFRQLGVIGLASGLFITTAAVSVCAQQDGAPETATPAPHIVKKPRVPRKAVVPSSNQAKPGPAAAPVAEAPEPTPPPAAAQQAAAPDPLVGDWKVVWLNKNNAVSAIHLAQIDRQPDMAAGNGTFTKSDGTQCHLDSGLAYQVYGQIPNGGQILSLTYSDIWKMVAHCDDMEVAFDLVAVSSGGGQVNAIGRAVINRKGLPPDSSFVLMQR